MKSFWKDKKVIVTGAAGFVGSHAVDLLVSRGAKVTAVISPKTDKNKIKKNLNNSIKDINIVECELREFSECLKLTKNKDAIMNFAAMDGGTKFKIEHSAEIFKANSEITLNMLESANKNRVDRILLVSSMVVYPNSAPQPMKEKYGLVQSLDENIDGYAWSKRFLEAAAKTYYSQYGLNIGIIRPSNIYGIRDHIDKGRVIPTFIMQALKNKPITLWNDGGQRMSFINVADLVRSALDILEKYAVCDPVNIGSANYISVKNLAKLIIQLTESKSRLETIHSQVKFKDRILDVAKAKKIIGFKKEIDISDGLQEVINFYMKQIYF